MRELLEIGKSGVIAANRAIDTTSHNIANANTEGYSRRRVNFTPLDFQRGGQSIGIGVNADQIQRLRSQILDEQLNQKETELANLKENVNVFEQLQSIFATDGEGDLDALVYKFFESFNQLAEKPEEIAFRENVIYQSDALIFKLQKISEELQQVKEDTLVSTRSDLASISTLLADIASLNLDITRSGAQGKEAGGALDLQTEKMRQLAELVDYEFERSETQSVEIRIEGVIVVRGNEAESVRQEVDPTNDVFRLRLSNGVALDRLSGVVGARIDLYTDVLPGLRDQINRFVEALVTEVNSIHRSGYGLSNATGLDFFDSDGLRMDTIAVNQTLRNDPGLIASSDQTNAPGNNQVAIQISNLANTVAVDGRTFGEYALGIAGNIGSRLSNFQITLNAAQASRDLLYNQQQAIAGVNVDEELANLIKFQNAYQASARVLATASEMYESLLAIV